MSKVNELVELGERAIQAGANREALVRMLELLAEIAEQKGNECLLRNGE